MGHDIIGDIHGHADKLTALLRTLGYRHRLGAWRHPERTAIFVGDVVDRGPGQLDTIHIVREMLDAGTGQAVMGNHEFNAIAWYMPDPECDGEHLRRRIPHNRKQHAAFLRETEHDPVRHAELVRWFLTLPLWLELPGLRVIHACWHPGHMAEIEPRLKPGRRLDPALVVAGSRRGSVEYRAIEGLLKGLEIALPPGAAFHDKEGKRRHHVRVRWWDRAADTYRKAAILGSPEEEAALPDTPIPDAARLGYYDEIPVFFGHYWWYGIPEPLSPHAACVDYGAGMGRSLVAYRWEGESVLRKEAFVSDE
ncbi:MAG: metallophosphoesterase [Burkholderiales bacterium]